MTRLTLCFCLAVAGIGAAAGCRSYEDFHRAERLAYRPEAAWPEEPPPAARAEERRRMLADALQRWRAVEPDTEAYRVGEGDLLRITILLRSSDTRTPSVEVPVGENGRTGVPLLGKVDLEGLTAGEIEEKLRRLYADGYYRDPTVVVSVAEYNSKSVLVTGSVRRPGLIELRHNRISLLEALSRAGGPAESAGDHIELVRSAGGPDRMERIEINIDEFLADPAEGGHAWVGHGDVVHVAQRRGQPKFYVLGFVNSPGAYPMPEGGETVHVMDAIAHARGLRAAARPENTVLLRRTANGQESHQLDLTRVASAKAPDMTLQPNDTVIVGTSWGRRTVDGFLHVIGFRGLAPSY